MTSVSRLLARRAPLPEKQLGALGRVAFGSLGLVALGCGLVLAGIEARVAVHGAPWAWVVAIILGIVALGGAALVRGAIRGRIRVRRQGVRRGAQR